ncbi:SipW-dependent-type signal peptide-containing protein [Microbacterium sp. A93]|uniref:SipW-dependent-type signal peptide-containing protein n=1 Tax=Microbacterium sp. A93 TaxID=3450716 RepID=UPI003F41E32A
MLAGALVLGVGGSATLAAWTDQEYASTQITAGTFSIVSRTADATTFAPHDTAASAVTLPLNATNLYPGQTRAAWIQITTVGTVPGTVQLTGVSAPVNDSRGTALSNALSVRIVATTTTSGAVPVCTTGTTGGVVYTGISNVPALTAQALLPNGTNFVNYCVIVTLPTAAATGAQGGVVTPTWTFTGTTG